MKKALLLLLLILTMPLAAQATGVTFSMNAIDYQYNRSTHQLTVTATSTFPNAVFTVLPVGMPTLSTCQTTYNSPTYTLTCYIPLSIGMRPFQIQSSTNQNPSSRDLSPYLTSNCLKWNATTSNATAKLHVCPALSIYPSPYQYNLEIDNVGSYHRWTTELIQQLNPTDFSQNNSLSIRMYPASSLNNFNVRNPQQGLFCALTPITNPDYKTVTCVSPATGSSAVPANTRFAIVILRRLPNGSVFAEPLAESPLLTVPALPPGVPNCQNNNDCTTMSTGSICNTNSGRCIACLQNSDCATDQICNSDNFCITPQPSGCHSNADCSTSTAGPICNTSNGQCLGCLQSSDCPSLVRCNGEMISGICNTTNNQCEPHPIDTCVINCQSNSDCGAGFACTNNQCVTFNESACSQDSDCGADSGKACNSGQCVTPNITQACENTSDCAKGLICRSGQCITASGGGICSLSREPKTDYSKNEISYGALALLFTLLLATRVRRKCTVRRLKTPSSQKDRFLR